MTSLTVNNANATLDALQDQFDGQEFLSATRQYRLAVYEEWEKDYSPAEDDYYDCFTFLIPGGYSRSFTPPKNVEDLYNYVSDYKDADDIVRQLERQFGYGNVFPLSALVHGQCHLYIGSHRVDAWDSGLIGFVVLDAKEARKTVKFSRKFRKLDFAENLVKAWNRYMNEPEYRYVVEEWNDEWKEYDVIENICGFATEDEAKAEAIKTAQYEFGDGWQNL